MRVWLINISAAQNMQMSLCCFCYWVVSFSAETTQ